MHEQLPLSFMELINKVFERISDGGGSVVVKSKKGVEDRVPYVKNLERYGKLDGEYWVFVVPPKGTIGKNYNGELYLEAGIYVGKPMLAIRESFPGAGSTGIVHIFPEEIISLEVLVPQ